MLLRRVVVSAQNRIARIGIHAAYVRDRRLYTREKAIMRIATIDLETDPFKHNRTPAPFAAGFYDGETYRDFWGDDCVSQLLHFLERYPFELTIYAHNGGKFDFWYLGHALSEPLLYIDSRLVRAKLFHHEVRDSYKILPVPLATIQKDEIDYRVMERDKREKHKESILKYLRSDCVYLYNAVSKFIDQFGDVLTIGGAALKELHKDYKTPRISPDDDATYRQFFHGGRCEVFEVGELHSKKGWKLYDVNSLYPYCMSNFPHPVGECDKILHTLPDAPFYLAHICAKSKGALPVRTKLGLSFPHGHIESYCTSHEIRMALQLGLIEITQVMEVYAWNETVTFDRFVNRWNEHKIAAETAGDTTGRTFAKLIQNNCYGKFAQNPERFRDFKLFKNENACVKAGFAVCGELGPHIVGSKPTDITPQMYKNVAVAASVTGAGRAVFMHAWAAAERCALGDTDSSWCESLPLELDALKLGAWKLEAEADTLYVAGKKLYAAWKRDFNEPKHKSRTKDRYIEGFYKIERGKRVPLKCASKGVRMAPEEIARVACGEVLEIPIDAPSLRVGRQAKFIARSIARTAQSA